MHVREGVGRRRPALRGIYRAYLPQSLGPQAGKHEKPIHFQQFQPLPDQGLRVRSMVQGHIGPQHSHRLRRVCHLRFGSAQLQRVPPGRFEGTVQQGGVLGIGLKEIGRRQRVARLQQGLCVPTTTDRLPVGPTRRFLHQPLQPRLHTPRDFLVQPRRSKAGGLLAHSRRQIHPSPHRNGIDRGRSGGRHGGE